MRVAAPAAWSERASDGALLLTQPDGGAVSVTPGLTLINTTPGWNTKGAGPAGNCGPTGTAGADCTTEDQHNGPGDKSEQGLRGAG